MTLVLTDDENYKNIAETIRETTESDDKYTPSEMAAGVRAAYEAGRNATNTESMISNTDELLTAIANGEKVISLDPNGSFSVSKTITVGENTIFNGNNALFTRAGGFEGIMFAIRKNSKMSNLRIDGNREAMTAPTWDKTIEITTREKCLIDNVTITNGNEAIICYGDDVVVTRCKITDCGGNGIHFSGANRTRVENCVIINSNLKEGMGHEDGGIIWSNLCGDTVCLNNYIEGSKCAFGSVDYEHNSFVKIIGNTTRNCTNIFQGLSYDNHPSDIIISDNQFFDSGKIELNRTNPTDAYTGNVNVLITNNIFDNSIISAKNVKKITVSANDIHNIADRVVFSNCENVSVTNNRIDTNSTYGIYVGGSCKTVSVVGNMVQSLKEAIVIYGDAEGVVTDNKVITTAEDATTGIKAQNNTLVSGNDITISAGVGILVGNKTVCTNNYIRCAIDTLLAVQVYGGTSNFIVANNYSNGKFSIGSTTNCVNVNNLKMS